MSTRFEPLVLADLDWLDGRPYSPLFDDIYFSAEDGLSESNHVFIEGNQLTSRWSNLPSDEDRSFVIAELGFGTGLNVLLAWKHFQQTAPSSARLHVFSAEKHPMSRDDLARSLALWPELSTQADALLAVYPTVLTPGCHTCVLEAGRVELTLMLGDALASFESLLVCGDAALEPHLRTWHVDAWFLDGFSPSKNPDIWSDALLVIVGLLSHSGTTLATFSAAGSVKRGLKAAGFVVSKQPGFGRKRDMMVGVFDTTPVVRLLRQTPWHVAHTTRRPEKQAIVLGAGLAGCSSASALARRGWQVTLVDAASDVGLGASGNHQAVLYPNLSAYSSTLSSFMLSSFLHAVRTYVPLIEEQRVKGRLTGVLQLAFNEKMRVSFARLAPWLMHYSALGRLVDSDEASHLAGITVRTGGLFIPQAGWIDSQDLCQTWARTPGINCVLNQAILGLHHEDGHWHVGGHHAPVLIIATGHQAASFPETQHLPFNAFRGQMTTVASGLRGLALQIPLCAEGHILPARDGRHWVGATYQAGRLDPACYVADDAENLDKLATFPVEPVWEPRVTGHWAGVRAVTPDYLPFVGPVADPLAFNQQFSALKAHAMQFIPFSGRYQPGLYVCAGFGSRGLSSIPLCADFLAASINQEPFGMSRAMIQSLSPARLLRRALTRSG